MDTEIRQKFPGLVSYSKKRFPYFDIDSFSELELEYFIYHAPRYELLITKIKDLICRIPKSDHPEKSNLKLKILDFGPHFFTQIIRKETDTIVDQLGWRFDSVSKLREYEKHIEFDLNNCVNEINWPETGEYEIIVACEIIEHVYTSPEFIFPFFKKILKRGGFLVIGTPNAVSLKNRLEMIVGRNPYELIRTTLNNPGHFREYTKQEIIDYAYLAGFKLFDSNISSIFNYINHGLIGKIYKKLTNILPSSYRDNMTLIFKKEEI